MTQEEKAKRYDEALTKARNIVNSINVGLIGKDSFEAVFPELKESEGEKIRKSLIDMLKNDEKCYLKEIAWLEEQGQHKKFRDSIQVGDKVIRNEDGVLVNLSQLKRVAKKDEKQGEQKPAWSEEDARFLNVATNILNASKVYTKSPDKYEDTINWLKSLKDRLQPQPKREWTKEDEEKMMSVFLGIEAYFPSIIYGESKEDALIWLKSLKERHTWRPSDEQMEGIRCTIKTLKYQLNAGDNRLDSLYNDLKKLREE